jgi:hypothetical protein
MSIYRFETKNPAGKFTERHPEWKDGVWNLWKNYGDSLGEGAIYIGLPQVNGSIMCFRGNCRW